MYELRHVSKIYKTPYGELAALSDVSLKLPSKGFIAIKGPSGSGKSTLLNLLSLLERPSEGEILFSGRDLSSLSEKEKEDFRAFACSFVYQHFNLDEACDAISNVALPLLIEGKSRQEAFEKAEALLAQHGLSSLKHKPVRLLSGGEKQRIAILRAIIHHPRVIFADEPTGALDEENASLIMKELKSIGQSRLVLIVSHNERLIEEHCDAIVSLQNGRLASSCSFLASAYQELDDERGKRKAFIPSLIFRNYRANGLKNALSIVSAAIGYACLLLCLGFFVGSEETFSNERNRTLDCLNAKISKTTTNEIEGSPFTLTQSTRPPMEEVDELLKEFPGIGIGNDYGYFFPEYSAFSLNGFSEEGASFVGIMDLTLSNREESFLIEGEAPTGISLDFCLVNDAFADKFGKDIVGKKLKIRNEISVSEDDVNENVDIVFSFRVTGVVEEFPFLNSPKVYYSYPALHGHLANWVLPTISQKKNKDYTIADLVDEASSSSSFSSYGYALFATDILEMERLRAFSSGLSNGFAITSGSWDVNEAFSELTGAFALSLIPFMIIEVIGVAFVSGFIAYSSFLARKKQAAILEALGVRKQDRALIYQSEPLINACLSSLAALVLAFPLMKIANIYLNGRIGIDSLISIPYLSYLDIPFFAFIAVFVFSFVTTLLGAALPLEIASRRSLVEELRDE